ncbi:hypothetical protein HK104_008616 [Borealophlyctis nickersoniae]|nr:hypothetical protein HK104_008616 [Borealophlyctis nickersoniae]
MLAEETAANWVNPVDGDPFAQIETHILSILTLAPSTILRSTAPHPPAPASPPPPVHFLPVRRSTSRSNSVSPSRSPTPGPQQSPLGSNGPALARVLSASSILASLIESVVSVHNDRILGELNDGDGLEEYQKCSEKVWESTFGVLKGVKRLREWDAGVGKWDAAKDLYSGLITDALLFVHALAAFADFSWRILRNQYRPIPRGLHETARIDSGVIMAPDLHGDGTGLPPPPAEVLTPGSAADKREEKNNKRKSFGTRIKERMTFLNDNRRQSMSSLSSDDSSNSSHPTRISRMSDASTTNPALFNDMYSIRSSSPPPLNMSKTPVVPGRSSLDSACPTTTRPEIGRSSLDTPRNMGGGRGMHFPRLSLDLPRLQIDGVRDGGVGRVPSEPPRLPEIVFSSSRENKPRGASPGRSPLGGQAYGAEVASLGQQLKTDSGESYTRRRSISDVGPYPQNLANAGANTMPRPRNSSVLKRPSANVRIRVARREEDSWRVRLPAETEDSDHTPEDEAPTSASPKASPTTIANINRWSRMVMDVTVSPSGGALARRPKSMIATPPRESESESEFDIRALSDDELLSSRRPSMFRVDGPDDTDDEAGWLKTPSAPTTPISPTASIAAVVDHPVSPPLSESPPEGVVFPPTTPTTPSAPVPAGIAADGEVRSSMDSERSVDADDESAGGSTGRKTSRYRFDSLRTVGRKGSQRIPTFDSQGRRIGVLDHGRFSSGVDFPDQEDAKGGSISVRGNLLHLSEDNREVLVMEMVGGKLHIMAGTVEKLLFRLADENIQDMEYVDCLIQTHTFFITSADLLDNLIARFYVEPPANAGSHEIEYFNKWQRPIQLKVLTVLGRWVKLQFEDFAEDHDLREELETFLDEVWREGYRSEADRIRRTATIQALSISARLKSTPFPRHILDPSVTRTYHQRLGCPFPLSSHSPLLDHNPILDCDARDLARYLTAADFHAFRSISVHDYVGKIGKAEKGRGRIDLFAARSNMLRNWVALEVCSMAKPKARRKLIEKYITVAKICRDFNNFHTTLLIVSGLLSPPVQRLKKTWDAVSSAHASALSSLEKLLDPSGNMRNYRRALAQATTPIISQHTGQQIMPGCALPFFPVVMKDVTFVMDGNPAYSKKHGNEGPETEGEDWERWRLVNFDKYRNLSRIINRYIAGIEGGAPTSGGGSGGLDRHHHNHYQHHQDFYLGTTGVMHALPFLLRAAHGGGGPAGPAIAAVGAGAVGKAFWGSNPPEMEHVALTVEKRVAFADDEKDGAGEVKGSEGAGGSGSGGMGRCMNAAWEMAGRAEGDDD